MVHLVPDEGIDDGPVLATAEVPIRPGDDRDGLEARIHAVEHELLVATLARLATGELPTPAATASPAATPSAHPVPESPR